MCQQLTIERFGIEQLALMLPQVSQVHGCCGLVRVEFDRFQKARFGHLKVSLLKANRAEIAVGINRLWIEPHGIFERAARLGQIAGGPISDSQV